MAEWTAEYLTMIEDCEKRSEKMTEWEQTFVDSLSHQLGTRNFITDKQIEVLDRIWEKVT